MSRYSHGEHRECCGESRGRGGQNNPTVLDRSAMLCFWCLQVELRERVQRGGERQVAKLAAASQKQRIEKGRVQEVGSNKRDGRLLIDSESVGLGRGS